MRTAKSPGAVAALGASEIDELGRHVVSEATFHRNFPQAPIHATLIGSDRCEAEGYTARGSAPVLALCRRLFAAGFDPGRPLHAYRGDTLSLVVRTIGEGAALTVAEGSRDMPRFRRWKPMPYREGSPRIARQERAAATLAGS
jgi:hypothetical protein